MGASIGFGNYRWRVLERRGDRALVITEEVIELRWYHDAFVPITWADCALRKYLNGELVARFTARERSRIVTVTNENRDNPWFGTDGGADTRDRIFLLSLDEVCKYFGDSTAKLENKGSQRWRIDDRNNQRRRARYGRDDHSWRLRSPGYYARTSASVTAEGHVYLRGNGVFGRPRDGGGIRPALWLKLDDR